LVALTALHLLLLLLLLLERSELLLSRQSHLGMGHLGLVILAGPHLAQLIGDDRRVLSLEYTELKPAFLRL
jgi:hypothetical protein